MTMIEADAVEIIRPTGTDGFDVVEDSRGAYIREMISGVKTPPPFSETLDLYICRGRGYRWWGDNGTTSPFFPDLPSELDALQDGDSPPALDRAFDWLETL